MRGGGERRRPGRARNASANSLANAGRGNTSTGAAVSTAAKRWCRSRPSVISPPELSRDGQPHRHLGLDFHFLQPAGRRVAEYRPEGHRTDHEADPHADNDPWQRLWHGAAVPAEHQQRAVDAAGGVRGDLRRAGHALRKLQPAADDPVHAALRRGRARCWR